MKKPDQKSPDKKSPVKRKPAVPIADLEAQIKNPNVQSAAAKAGGEESKEV